MHRILLLMVVLSSTTCSCGCSMMRDLMFNALGDSYTAGGYTHEDRQRHYNREISRWEGGPQHYDPVTDR